MTGKRCFLKVGDPTITSLEGKNDDAPMGFGGSPLLKKLPRSRSFIMIYGAERLASQKYSFWEYNVPARKQPLLRSLECFGC